MNCRKCNHEFDPESLSECTQVDSTVCPRCTFTDPKLHRCDMVCQARSIKFIDYHPLTDGFMGFGSMTQVTTTTEEFMPSIYRFVYAHVSSLDIKLHEMNRLSVVVKMRLSGSPSLLSQAFVKEGWKGMHLSKALEESDITKMEQPAPILVVRPQQWLRIAPETLRLKIDNKSQPVTLSDRHELIGTPVSDPPPSSHHYGSEPEPRGTYSYYGGKFSSIYGPLVLDKDYLVEFDIEAVNPLYSLDFFFPYAYVDLDGVSVSHEPRKGIHAGGPVYGIAKPMISDMLTPEYEYKLNKPDDEYPRFEKAEPFRNSPPIIAPGEIDFKPIDKDTAYPINLDDYKLISVQFQFALIPSQLPHGLIVQPKVTDRAIPIRTYEQMQRLPEYRDFLIQIDIFNADHDNDRELEVESEIIGYTERATQRVTVPKLGGEEGPARKVIAMPPIKTRHIAGHDWTNERGPSLQSI